MREVFTTPGGLSGGHGRRAAVLLLHGDPGMTDYMDSLLAELHGYQVASFQRRGVASSTVDGRFDVPTLRDDVAEVLETLAWLAPAVIGHSWGRHFLLHLMVAAPHRVGAALMVAAIGALGGGGWAELEADVLRRLPRTTVAKLEELDQLEATRALTTQEVLAAMALVFPAYFSSLEVAQPIPQTGHAPSDETWALIRSEQPRLAHVLRGCAVSARFVHGRSIRVIVLFGEVEDHTSGLGLLSEPVWVAGGSPRPTGRGRRRVVTFSLLHRAHGRMPAVAPNRV